MSNVAEIQNDRQAPRWLPSVVLKLDFAIPRKVIGVEISVMHVFTLEIAKELIYDLYTLYIDEFFFKKL